MHEIITLQLGQRSNYLATHFWNTQESYFTYSADDQSPVDHDVHFRAGTAVDGSETFTPRALIYDLKGGFGSLRKYNALYEMQDEFGLPKGLWDGKLVVQQQSSIAQTEYQRSLDQGLPAPKLGVDSVRYWSDFNRVYYHPRSIVQLNDYELNSQLMPFEDWGIGEELFNNIDKEHDILDRDLRPFAEECDQLKAFQLFTGTDDAWGGFAARYMDRLRDEFGKKSIWVWGLENGLKAQRSTQISRMTNMARSLHEISPLSSAYVPISDPPVALPPYISLNRSSEWQSSALLTAAIETVTIPSRLRSINGKHGSFDDFETILNSNGNQKILKLQSSIMNHSTSNGETRDQSTKTMESQNPLHGQGLAPDSVEEDTAEEGLLGAAYDMDFTPEGLEQLRRKRVHYFGQVEVFRNGDSTRNANSEHEEKRGPLGHGPQIERYETALLFPLIDTFPGEMLSVPRQSHSIAIKSALASTTEVAERIKAIQRVIGRSFHVEERENLSNGLGEICDAYEEGYDSGSESSDDD